jgi:hypothetical protein
VFAFVSDATSFKLVSNDGAQSDTFGTAVAADGGSAVVGAPGDTANGTNSGSAYAYTESGGTWTEQAKLLPGDGSSNDQFGLAVAISGDTAIIGAPNDSANGTDSGSVYVFVRSDGAWSQQAKLTPADASQNDQFGRSVAVSGETLVVGAPTDTPSGTDSGVVYVFVRSDGTWTEQAKLTASNGGQGHNFGWSVSVDGDSLVAGAFGELSNGTDSGAAYVFVLSDGTWSEQAKLTGDDTVGEDTLGRSVSIDGDHVVAGAPGDKAQGTDSGSAYIFVRAAGVWTQQARIAASDGAQNDNFGWSVSISGDKVAATAFGDTVKGTDSGSVYVYVRDGETWSQQANLTASDGKGGDRLGRSVVINGNNLVAGAPNDTEKGTDSGSANVFVAELQ